MRAHIEDSAGPYGFGRTWTLVLEHNGTVRRYWLGQDAKVVSRMLGYRFSEYVDHMRREHGTDEFDKLREHIACDVLRAIGYDSENPLDNDSIMQLQDWELAV